MSTRSERRRERKEWEKEVTPKLSEKLILPDLEEWKTEWKKRLDDFVSRTRLYAIRYGSDTIEEITSGNAEELVSDSYKITTGEWRGRPDYYVNYQEDMITEATSAFDKFICEHNREILKSIDELEVRQLVDHLKSDTQITSYDQCEDEYLIEIFTSWFSDIYNKYTYGIFLDYTEDDFIRAYTTD